jgi:predicted branched-subunit amino acid permease
VTRYNQPDPSPYKHWYHLGSAVFMYGNWQVWTWVGILAGQYIADPQSWGLDFALIVTFIGMLVPMVINRPVLAAVLAAGGVAVLANDLPNRLGLIVAALAGVLAGVLAEAIQGPVPAAPVVPETTDPGP